MNTIKSSSDITYLFEHGQRVNTPDVGILVSRHEERHDQPGRVAFVAGKRQGNAVWRNKAKRRMRAVCREVGGPFTGYDVVFVARRTVNETSYEKVVRRVRKALVKSGIIVD